RPRLSSSSAVRGADAAISTVPRSSGTTCAPVSSGGTSRSGRRACAGWPMRVPSGSAVTADFRWRTSDSSTGTTRRPGSSAANWAMPWPSVRPADVDGLAGLQDVAAVERARPRHPYRVEPEIPYGALDGVHLGPPLRRARPGEYGDTVGDDDRVPHDRGVGRDVPRAPAGGGDRGDERGDVGGVLFGGEVAVDGLAPDVGDDALGDPRAGFPHQGDAGHRAFCITPELESRYAGRRDSGPDQGTGRRGARPAHQAGGGRADHRRGERPRPAAGGGARPVLGPAAAAARPARGGRRPRRRGVPPGGPGGELPAVGKPLAPVGAVRLTAAMRIEHAETSTNPVADRHVNEAMGLEL